MYFTFSQFHICTVNKISKLRNLQRLFQERYIYQPQIIATKHATTQPGTLENWIHFQESVIHQVNAPHQCTHVRLVPATLTRYPTSGSAFTGGVSSSAPVPWRKSCKVAGVIPNLCRADPKRGARTVQCAPEERVTHYVSVNVWPMVSSRWGRQLHLNRGHCDWCTARLAAHIWSLRDAPMKLPTSARSTVRERWKGKFDDGVVRASISICENCHHLLLTWFNSYISNFSCA